MRDIELHNQHRCWQFTGAATTAYPPSTLPVQAHTHTPHTVQHNTSTAQPLTASKMVDHYHGDADHKLQVALPACTCCYWLRSL